MMATAHHETQDVRTFEWTEGGAAGSPRNAGDRWAGRGPRPGPAASRRGRPSAGALALALVAFAVLAVGGALGTPLGPTHGSAIPQTSFPASTAASSWPQFHGDPMLDGVSTSVAPAGTVLYTVDLSKALGGLPGNPLGNDYPYQSSPSTDGSAVAVTLDNTVLTVSASNGALLWQRALPGGNGSGPVVNTPLWSNGQIILGQDGGPNNLVALDANNGTVAWSLQTPGGGNPMASSVTDVAGLLTVADLNGGFFLRPARALGPWTSAVTPGPAAYYATPSFAVVAGGGPTIILPDRGNRSLDAFTPGGTMLPGFPLAPRQQLDKLFSSAAIVNLTDPTGGGVSTWAIFGGEGGAAAPSHVYAVDLSAPSGILALTVPALGTGDSGVRGTPAVVATGAIISIYFGTRGGGVSHVDLSPFAAGGPSWNWVWNQSTAGPIDASPVIVGSEVLVPSEDGSLYAFALTDGTLLWRVSTGAPLYASPAVAGGTCWVVNANGVLTAVGGVLATTPPGGGGNTPKSGSISSNAALWTAVAAVAAVLVLALLVVYLRRRGKHGSGSKPASPPPATTATPGSSTSTWAPSPGPGSPSSSSAPASSPPGSP